MKEQRTQSSAAVFWSFIPSIAIEHSITLKSDKICKM